MAEARRQIQLDITYHYPPELLELLCDVVPVLFRSKQAVIDFFVGAGVPNRHLSDWKLKLKQDKETVKKPVIARSVLCRINDDGEPALAVRREVLKRISEFEDFSICWEDDRYKAQSLVTQIQKLVNVKDSFTRMNLERERERKQHQSAYTTTVLEKQKQAKERATLKDALYKLFAETNVWKRGKLLESCLNNLFASAGLLVREAFTIKGDEAQGVVEQIDGAVEIDGLLYIVEMKWWESPIGRQELAPHMVSVFNRGNVGGIFISYSGFSPAAIEDAKMGLTQKTFVLTELQEIIEVIEREGDLKVFYKEKINRARTDRTPLYKLS